MTTVTGINDNINVYLLDKDYSIIYVFDEYISLNWADRYYGPGEFEFSVPCFARYMAMLDTDLYLSIDSSDQYMVIESIDTTTDSEEGPSIKVSGRTLDSVLERRIIYPLETVSGPIGAAIQKLITDNIISPTNPNRAIGGVTFEQVGDADILNTALEEESVYKKGLLDTVSTLCTEYGIGYKAIPKEEGGFIFQIYTGTDRSWSQSNTAAVVFSSDYDNLIATTYVKSMHDYKNTGYAFADISWKTGDTEQSKTVVQVVNDENRGLNRREMAIDSDAVRPEGCENFTSESQWNGYIALVKQSGVKAVRELMNVEAMDGKMDAFGQFKYGVHFFLGDIVEVENEFGITAKCRVSEIVMSVDATGISYVPTFEFLDKEE